MGRLLIAAGITLVCLGILVLLLQRFHIHPGRMPGDIVFRSKGGTVGAVAAEPPLSQ